MYISNHHTSDTYSDGAAILDQIGVLIRIGVLIEIGALTDKNTFDFRCLFKRERLSEERH